MEKMITDAFEESVERDEDGFRKLTFEDEGQKTLEQLRNKRTKKSKKSKPPSPQKKPYENFHFRAAAELKLAEEYVSKGKFGKAAKALPPDKLNELCDAFLHMDQGLGTAKDVNHCTERVLRLAKAFYEHDGEKDRRLIPDNVYDGLIARWRELGFTEPNPAVPGGKESRKSGIRYPTLHNNMDKAARILDTDPMPEGPSEQNSTTAETWLRKTYRTLELSTETPIDLELSVKVDGTSVNGTQCMGILTDPQTRGDNDEAVNVTGLDGLELDPKARDVESETYGIQGEAFVTAEDAAKAAEYLGREPYRTLRQAASGLIQRLSTNGCDEKLAQFISFFPINTEGLSGTYLERMERIQRFAIVPDDMIKRKVIRGNMRTLLEKIRKRFRKLEEVRGRLSYAIDGMVLTVPDDEFQKKLGRSGRTNGWQLALKFDPENADTTASGVHLDSGKRGFRTIQLDLEPPIFLGGQRYDHCTIPSKKIFENLGLRKGSVVRVHRVNDVYPEITVKRIGTGIPLELPSKCPDCGEPLVAKNKKLFCDNPACPGNIAGRIRGFLSNLGMDGYDEKFAESLVEKFGVKTLSDLFSLTPRRFADGGVNTKLAREFLDSLEEHIVETNDYVILGSVGIPEIGMSRAMDLIGAYARTHGSRHPDGTNPFDVMLSVLFADDPTSDPAPMELKKTGEKFRHVLYENREMRKNILGDLKEIRKRMKRFMKAPPAGKAPLLGYTGFPQGTHPWNFMDGETRDAVDRNGFKLTSGRRFDVLLAYSKSPETEKIRLARENGIPVYTVEEFAEKYRE